MTKKDEKNEARDREERLPQPGLDEEPGEEGGEPSVEEPSRPALDPEQPEEEERHFSA